MACDNWPSMVCIFNDRINGRFLEPIRLIENDKAIGQFAGFSILALDCLLIETLNQFYQGIDETPVRQLRKQFWIFFRNSEYFSEHFTEESAKAFYYHVRCGLLHQAQTKKLTFIRADQKAMIQLTNGNPSDGIIVDRVKFHQALKDEIDSYMTKLVSDNAAHAVLKENFVKKMQIICGGAD